MWPPDSPDTSTVAATTASTCAGTPAEILDSYRPRPRIMTTHHGHPPVMSIPGRVALVCVGARESDEGAGFAPGRASQRVCQGLAGAPEQVADTLRTRRAEGLDRITVLPPFDGTVELLARHLL